MAASQLSLRRAYYHTAELTTVDISASTLLGTLSEDTELPEPENVTDAFQTGEAEVGAIVDVNLRVLGSGSGVLSSIQTAKDANPPTELWFYFPNRSGTAVTRYGPAIVKQAYALGDQSEPKRQSYRVRFKVVQDTSELAVQRVAGTVVLPT